MATKRKPAQAEEVMEFFQTRPINECEMLLRLITFHFKKRLGDAPKPERKPRRAATADATPDMPIAAK